MIFFDGYLMLDDVGFIILEIFITPGKDVLKLFKKTNVF